VLYVNGVHHPSEPLTTDCSSPCRGTRAYKALFSSVGIHHHVRAHMITLELFTKSFYVLGFDETPNGGADEELISLQRQRIVRIGACL